MDSQTGFYLSPVFLLLIKKIILSYGESTVSQTMILVFFVIFKRDFQLSTGPLMFFEVLFGEEEDSGEQTRVFREKRT